MKLEQLKQEHAELSKQARQLRMLAANVTSNTNIEHASNEIQAFLNGLRACAPAMAWLHELLEANPDADPQLVGGRPQAKVPTQSVDAATAYHYRLVTEAVKGSHSIFEIMHVARGWSPDFNALLNEFNRLHFSRFWKALSDVLSDQLNALQAEIAAATPKQPHSVQQVVQGPFHGVMVAGDMNQSTITINNAMDLASQLATLRQGLDDLSEADSAATAGALDALVEIAEGKEEASSVEVAQHLDTVIKAGSRFAESLREIMMGAAGSIAAHVIVQAYHFLARTGAAGL